MDVWGPAYVRGQDQERHFLLVVDDYTRYTTVFPLLSKADVRGVLIPWITAVRQKMRARFQQDLQVLRLHSDRGGEFSSRLIEGFRRAEGIVKSFTISDSPQQNGIAERRIGLIIKVARTYMIHAAAPHFLWPFVVRYAAHQLNLWPRVSMPETSPTLRWMGEVGDASAFRVWGALSLVHDTTAGKLSPRTLRCIFLGFPTDAPPWQFYHPTSRRVLSSQDPLEISSDPSGPPEGGDAADGMATTRRSPRLETPPGFLPRPSSPPPQPVAVDSGAAGDSDTGGTGSGGAGPGVAEFRGAESGGAGSGGADCRGAESGGAGSGGAASPSGGGAVGAPTGAAGAGGAGAADAGGTSAACAGGARAAGTRGTGARGAGGTGAIGPEGAGAAGAGGTGAAGAGGAGAAGAGGAGGTGAGGAGGAGGTGAAGGAGGAGAAGGTGAAGAGGTGAGGAGGIGGVGACGTGGAGDMQIM
ncbi:unnamed protein product [Closterium sp. Yama58-4]|nr:unnamed protein product [Closterium sp. Yama58-4]